MEKCLFFFKHNTGPYPDTESDSPYGMSATHNMKHWGQVAMATWVTQGHLWEERPGEVLLVPSSCLLLNLLVSGQTTSLGRPTSSRPLDKADSASGVVLPEAIRSPEGPQEATPPAKDSGFKALWHSSHLTSQARPGGVSVISTFYR